MEKPVPIKEVCCGAFCSEAGCCLRDKEGEPITRDLFPNEFKHSNKQFPDIRDYVHRRTPKPAYHLTIPDWVKENRNRDTDSNI